MVRGSQLLSRGGIVAAPVLLLLVFWGGGAFAGGLGSNSQVGAIRAAATPTTSLAPVDLRRSHLMASSQSSEYPVMGPESLMDKKEHGTCTKPVQENLLYGVDREVKG